LPSLGPLEIVVIFVVALLVFGPQKLPELGRQLGKALREFQRVQDQFQSEVRTAFDTTDPTPPKAPTPAPLAPGPPDDPASRPLGHFERDVAGQTGVAAQGEPPPDPPAPAAGPEPDGTA